MPQKSSMTDSGNDQLKALADAAWRLLASHHIDKIDLTMVANHAGVSYGLAAALGGSVQRLILVKMEMLDQQSLLESYGDIEEAGDVSIREKIIEGLLHRFEVYAQYRSQITSLSQSARTHPEMAMRLIDGLESVVRRILVMSGDSASGIRGTFRVKGVVGVLLVVARVWMKDESTDLAATMKALDQRMQQAEEWGMTLNVFDDRRCRRSRVDDPTAEDLLDGRYGVYND